MRIKHDDSAFDCELNFLVSENELETLNSFAQHYKDAAKELEASKPEGTMKIREFQCLGLFTAFKIMKIQESPQKEQIDAWIINLNSLYHYLRYEDPLSHLELLKRQKLRVFLLSMKTLAMTFSNEYHPIQLLSSFYHFLCEMQSYRNLAIRIAKNENMADLPFIEEALLLFPPPENSKPLNSTCCSLIRTHATSIQAFISVREEFHESDVLFTAWAIESFQNNNIEIGDPTPIPSDIENFSFESFQNQLLREIGRLLNSDHIGIKPIILKKQIIMAKILFLQLQIEFSLDENEENKRTIFHNDGQENYWKFYREISLRINNLIYLLHFFSETQEIGFLAFEKFRLYREKTAESPEIEQSLKALKLLCIMERDSDFSTLINHLSTMEDVDFKKISLYYLAEKAQQKGVALKMAASMACETVPVVFEVLSALFLNQLKSTHIDLIINYLGSIIEKTPGLDELMFILPFFLICKKILNLNHPQLSLLVNSALVKFQKSTLQNKPHKNQILEQAGLACELGRLKSMKDPDQIEALELEINKKSDEIRNESASPFQKLELIALYCLQTACTYERIRMAAEKAKPTAPITIFFSSIEKIEAMIQVEAKASAEEKLLLHKMKVFLLSLKLHIRVLAGGGKELVMGDFLHFTCAMQNYKNLAELTSKTTEVASENLQGLISDATQLFQNATTNNNRNYWCFYTMLAFVDSIKHIREFDKKNYADYELGCIRYCFDSLRKPDDFTPKKDIDESHEDLSKKVPGEIIKILLSPQKNKKPALVLESFFVLHLFFLRLRLLGLYTEELDSVRKEKLKQNLLAVHQNLKNNLPWLILYHHFAPSPYSSCVSVQSVLDPDEILGFSQSPSDKLKKNPHPFFQKISEASQTEEELIKYLQNSKKDKILSQPKKEFSVFAKFFLICQKALLSKNAKLISQAKDALKVEEASIEDMVKKLGPNSQAKKSSTSKKPKPPKQKPPTQQAKPINPESKPTQKAVNPTVTEPVIQATAPAPTTTQTSAVEKKSTKKKKKKKKTETETSPPQISEKIFGAETLESCEAEKPSDTPEKTLTPTESEEPTEFQPSAPLSESSKIPEKKKGRTPLLATAEPYVLNHSSITLDRYLSECEKPEVSKTFLQVKCHPIHELIKILNSEASRDNNFKFATFLTGGALLYYFRSYLTPIHDYDLRCNAPLEKIEAKLLALKESHPELGISEIRYHGKNSKHPQVFLTFMKYPGLRVEVASMNIDAQVESFLQLIMLNQLMYSDFIVNSIFYTQCGSMEFIIDFQKAIVALSQRPRLLDRTPYEHPPENKVLIILRGLKFLAKYLDFQPSVDLIGWIKENKTCFQEVNCFVHSAHAFIKLIYSGYIYNILLRMNHHNILDLLTILCPPIYRLMQSDHGLFSVLNTARAIDLNLSLGFKNRETMEGEYWRVLGDALACFLTPAHERVNLPVLPLQINLIREKKPINWAEFWKPIQATDETASKAESSLSLN